MSTLDFTGERQVAATLAGIRSDHKARYVWAFQQIAPSAHILDIGCGIGYGAWLMANGVKDSHVTAIDQSNLAINYARQHWSSPNIEYVCADATDASRIPERHYDVVTAFEFIEHVAEPGSILEALAPRCSTLLCSVPNEDRIPFSPGFKYHHRHYTEAQLRELLASHFNVEGVFGQLTKHSPVSPNRALKECRTLVVRAMSRSWS